MPYGNGQEYAVVLPRSSAGQLFAQTYLNAQRNAQRVAQANERAAAKQKAITYEDLKKDEENGQKVIQEAIKNYAGVKLSDVYSEMGRNLATNRVSEMQAMHLKGAKAVDIQNMANETAMALANISRRGSELDASIARVQQQYDLEGVDKESVGAFLKKYVIDNKLVDGNKPITDDKLGKIAYENRNAFIKNGDALSKGFAGIGTAKVANKKGSNLKMNSTAITAPLDTEWDGEKVVVKSELFDAGAVRDPSPVTSVPTISRPMRLDNPMRASLFTQVFGDNDGKIPLYDKEFYDVLMGNPAFAFNIDAKAEKFMKAYEAETGEKLDRYGLMAENFRRAVVYKEREAGVNSNYQQANVTHMTVNTGGGRSGGAGGAPVNFTDVYTKMKVYFDEQILNGNNAIPISGSNVEPEVADRILKTAISRYSADEQKDLGDKDFVIKATGNNEMGVYRVLNPTRKANEPVLTERYPKFNLSKKYINEAFNMGQKSDNAAVYGSGTMSEAERNKYKSN
jgi:hypothetical protein